MSANSAANPSGNNSGQNTQNHPWRVAVVGAGISGLAAAHRLIELAASGTTPAIPAADGAAPKGPLQLTLYEAGPHVGGVIGTERRNGYLVERGADMFVTDKPAGVNLCRRLGLADQLLSTDETFRRSLVLHKGKPVPVPEGFLLLSPARIGPVLRSPLFSWAGKLRMACEYFLPPRKTEDDESLASFVRRRFGREVLERLIQPLVGGIYTADPEKLSMQATLARFVQMEREDGSLIRASRKRVASQRAGTPNASGARYGLFVSLKEGLQQLLDALLQRIESAATLALNTKVHAVRRQTSRPDTAGGKTDGTETSPPATTTPATSVGESSAESSGWQLELSDGSRVACDAVILAVPSYRAAELLAESAPALSRSLSEIEYASSAVVVSGHALQDIAHPLEAFGLVVPACEERRILAVSFASRKFPGRAPEGRILLRTFLGGALQPEILQHSDEELVQIVREELADIFGVQGEPDFMQVLRYPRAMPQYHVGHLRRVAQIEDELKTQPALQLAGNAYHGVGIPDCIHSGETAAEKLWSSRDDNAASVSGTAATDGSATDGRSTHQTTDRQNR